MNTVTKETKKGVISLFDKETENQNLFISSISVGSGGTPHAPPAGGQTSGLLR
jgi:hypothetical protein